MSLPRGCRVPGYVATSTRQDPAKCGKRPRAVAETLNQWPLGIQCVLLGYCVGPTRLVCTVCAPHQVHVIFAQHDDLCLGRPTVSAQLFLPKSGFSRSIQICRVTIRSTHIRWIAVPASRKAVGGNDKSASHPMQHASPAPRTDLKFHPDPIVDRPGRCCVR